MILSLVSAMSHDRRWDALGSMAFIESSPILEMYKRNFLGHLPRLAVTSFHRPPMRLAVTEPPYLYQRNSDSESTVCM